MKNILNIFRKVKLLKDMKIRLRTGPHPIKWSPVCVKSSIETEYNSASLIGTDSKEIPCQIDKAGDSTILTWIVESAPANTEIVYQFKPCGSGVTSTDTVEVIEAGSSKLSVNIDGRLFTEYNYGTDWVRPFLYPVIGPNGAGITRNWPIKEGIPGESTDHKHHKGIYIAYGDINKTDNWSEDGPHGCIRHKCFDVLESGPVYGRFRSINDWVDHNGNQQMEDVRQFTFYNCPAGERIIDVEVKLIASYGDVHFGGTKEGGMISVRVATSMDGNKGGRIVNSYGGETERETWGKPAHWVDYYGPVQGDIVGIAIMDHPDSFRYPSRWHVRDYGLFTANVFALQDYEPHKGISGDFLLKEGGSLYFRYRLYIHSGNTDQADVRNKYLAFIEPPSIKVE